MRVSKASAQIQGKIQKSRSKPIDIAPLALFLHLEPCVPVLPLVYPQPASIVESRAISMEMGAMSRGIQHRLKEKTPEVMSRGAQNTRQSCSTDSNQKGLIVEGNVQPGTSEKMPAHHQT